MPGIIFFEVLANDVDRARDTEGNAFILWESDEQAH